jgi:hypothetical protein
MGKFSRTKHSKVLSVLEKRALRYKNTGKYCVNDGRLNERFDSIDETGTVEADLIIEDEMDEEIEIEEGLR